MLSRNVSRHAYAPRAPGKTRDRMLHLIDVVILTKLVILPQPNTEPLRVDSVHRDSVVLENRVDDQTPGDPGVHVFPKIGGRGPCGACHLFHAISTTNAGDAGK